MNSQEIQPRTGPEDQLLAQPAATFAPQLAHVSENSVGTLELAPPSFLERWGVILLAIFSLWIVVVGTVLLVWFLTHQPPTLSLANLTADQLRDTVNTQKLLDDRWHTSLDYLFDLLITKTALPLVTLLLGYLFGKGQSANP